MKKRVGLSFEGETSLSEVVALMRKKAPAITNALRVAANEALDHARAETARKMRKTYTLNSAQTNKTRIKVVKITARGGTEQGEVRMSSATINAADNTSTTWRGAASKRSKKAYRSRKTAVSKKGEIKTKGMTAYVKDYRNRPAFKVDKSFALPSKKSTKGFFLYRRVRKGDDGIQGFRLAGVAQKFRKVGMRHSITALMYRKLRERFMHHKERADQLLAATRSARGRRKK